MGITAARSEARRAESRANDAEQKLRAFEDKLTQASKKYDEEEREGLSFLKSLFMCL